MIVKEFVGDLFAAPGDAIGHGCNTKGVMGLGVAKIVRDKFPVVYDNYHEFCRAELLDAGDCFALRENGVWVFNLMTQRYPGADAKLPWVKSAIETMGDNALYFGLYHVNIPRIGCGIGGLTWDEVLPVLEDIDSELELHVYRLEA